MFDRRRVYVVDFNLLRSLSSLLFELGNDIHASFVFIQHLYAFWKVNRFLITNDLSADAQSKVDSKRLTVAIKNGCTSYWLAVDYFLRFISICIIIYKNPTICQFSLQLFFSVNFYDPICWKLKRMTCRFYGCYA